MSRMFAEIRKRYYEAVIVDFRNKKLRGPDKIKQSIIRGTLTGLFGVLLSLFFASGFVRCDVKNGHQTFYAASTRE